MMSIPPDTATPQNSCRVIYPDGRDVAYRADEPIFVLRAQDKLAPEVVEAWAFRLEEAERERHEALEKMPWNVTDAYEPSHKIREARAIAHQMRAWQELNDSKEPD